MSEAAADFLEPVMSGRDWKGLELAVFRLLEHCGWENLQYVGESGDMGADILGVRYNSKTNEYESYLVQVKAVSGDNYIGTAAVDQAVQGQGFYGCKIAVVVTNGEFRRSAYTRKDELNRLHFNVKLWNGVFLSQLLSKFPEVSSKLKKPHEYQDKIIDKVIETYKGGGKKALYIVATGMGKTIIASTIANKLYAAGLKKILIVCHSIPLAIQLQKSFWSQIGKSMKTRLFMDGKIPVPIDGINFGLYQTLYNNLGGLQPGVFDLIIVDEAHHARANAFEVCLNHLKPRFLIGMTATPWRSDGLALEQMFGVPLAKVSLVDGMRLGYLSKVDYRLMCDNINWSEVSKMSKKKISVRDLNKRLFIPQRDDAIISEVMKVARGMRRPKIAVFSPSVAHAESFAKLLNIAGIPTGCVTSKNKQNAHKTLLEFSSDKLSAITAVDILNEGIDVPDINVLVFLRTTHSRRIFVQQLGRGLRTSKFKDKVVVLDFVTDIRRIALVKAFNDETKTPQVPGDISTVYLKDGVVTFNDTKSQRFIDAWLNDVASLEDRDDAEKLEFPDITEV